MSDLPPINLYIEGGSARLTATLFDDEGVPVDPSRVRLLVLPARATISSVVPINVVGTQCIAVIPLPVHGTWKFRFEALDAPYAVFEGQFPVAPRMVPAPPEATPL